MHKITEILLAAALVIVVFFAGLIITLAVKGNTELTRQMTDRDAKAYTQCIADHVWSPTECRVGEYGTR